MTSAPRLPALPAVARIGEKLAAPSAFGGKSNPFGRSPIERRYGG